LASCRTCATVAPSAAVTLHMRIELPPVVPAAVDRQRHRNRRAGRDLRSGPHLWLVAFHARRSGRREAAPASGRTASCVAYRSSLPSPACHWKLPSGFCWASRKSTASLPCAVIQLRGSTPQRRSPLATQPVVSVLRPSDELTNRPWRVLGRVQIGRTPVRVRDPGVPRRLRTARRSRARAYPHPMLPRPRRSSSPPSGSCCSRRLCASVLITSLARRSRRARAARRHRRWSRPDRELVSVELGGQVGEEVGLSV